MIKVFTCPVCGEEHVFKIDRRVNDNMNIAFPTTYGEGKLICNLCCEIRLMEISKK